MRREIVAKIASLEGVIWCAITTNEGFIEEVAGAPAKFLESTASLLPSMLESVATVLANVNLGEPTTVTIIGEDGILAISSVNEHFALVSQLDDGANLSLIRRLMNEGTSHLRPLMS